MHSSVTIVGVVIGVVILFFGRKLFWLCVAAVGFAVGVQIAPLLVNEASSLLALVIALAFGVLGVLLALFHSKSCDSGTRFLGGRKARHCDRRCVFCAVCAILDDHLRHRRHYWGNSIAGRVWLGTDRCVIVYRRVLIQSAIVLPPTGSTLVFIGLAILGMFVQAVSFRRSAI